MSPRDISAISSGVPSNEWPPGSVSAFGIVSSLAGNPAGMLRAAAAICKRAYQDRCSNCSSLATLAAMRQGLVAGVT